jgi:LysM repeat protein
MADYRRIRRNTARIVAPLALLACGVAIALVVTSFTDDQKDDEPGERTTTQSGEQTTPQNGDGRRSGRRIYRVKLNDTLGLIAEKTGVPVERLQELNPELDPQNLIVGQRVKLRE